MNGMEPVLLCRNRKFNISFILRSGTYYDAISKQLYPNPYFHTSDAWSPLNTTHAFRKGGLVKQYDDVRNSYYMGILIPEYTIPEKKILQSYIFVKNPSIYPLRPRGKLASSQELNNVILRLFLLIHKCLIITV